MDKIKILDVMPGSKLILCDTEVILFGIPPEVIKALTIKKLPFPTALLIPDKLIIDTNLQNCTEFPLYHFLFANDGLNQKRKLKILGHKKNIDNNEKLLNLTLLGPTADQFVSIGIDETLTEMFKKECQYLHLKNESGYNYTISDYIENHSFNDKDQIYLGEIQLSSIGINKYNVEYKNEKVIVDINTDQEQIPPYPVQIDCTPNELCKFGIEILGGATGFSATNASSGLVIIYNGSYLLVDSIPFLDYHLVARGVAKSQVTSIFLTHVHDDHCNLLPLLFGANKVKIITTKEIYWMALYKMSLMLDCSIQEMTNYFDLVPLTVGKILDYYGLKIKPHYTIHSIPTIGAQFSINHNNHIYSMIITGDNQSLNDVHNMLKKEIISKTRAAKIEEIFTKETNLLIADGGEGLIHGTPRDALLSPADRVVFFHLDKLPLEFNATFSFASAGKRYVIVKGETDYYMTQAIEFFIQHFGDIELSWISILMGNMNITRFNTDDVIIKQGAVTKNKIYLLITGYCSIVVHDGIKPVEIARKEAGDFFGEMAITTGIKVRNASVLARSPVTLCELSEQIFNVLLIKEKLKEKLINKWNCLEMLDQLDYFKNFSHIVLDRLAQHATLKEFTPNNKLLYDQVNPLFHIILKGVVEKNHNGQISILTTGDFFGDTGFFNDNQSDFTTKEATSCLVFLKSVIQDILSKTPNLLFSLKDKIN